MLVNVMEYIFLLEKTIVVDIRQSYCIRQRILERLKVQVRNSWVSVCAVRTV